MVESIYLKLRNSKGKFIKNLYLFNSGLRVFRIVKTNNKKNTTIRKRLTIFVPTAKPITKATSRKFIKVGFDNNFIERSVKSRYSKVKKDSKVVKCANCINAGDNEANKVANNA